MSLILAALSYAFHLTSDWITTKPVFATTAGAAVGLGGWLVGWVDRATQLFQLGAGFFGLVAAFFAVLLATPKVLRFIRNWRARGLLAADQE